MAFFHHDLKGACIIARCFPLICQPSSLLCSPVIKTVLGTVKAFNKYFWIKEWVTSGHIKLPLILLNSSSFINVHVYVITKFCWFRLLNKSRFTFFFSVQNLQSLRITCRTIESHYLKRRQLNLPVLYFQITGLTTYGRSVEL